MIKVTRLDGSNYTVSLGPYCKRLVAESMMANEHTKGPFEVRPVEKGWAVYAKRCDCHLCNGGPTPWPLATWREGKLTVPPLGVTAEPLRMLLKEAKVI